MVSLHHDWVWPAVLAVGAVGLAAYLVLNPPSDPRRHFAWIGPLGLLYFAFLSASWSAQLDESGVKVNAPLSFEAQSGAIPWSDVRTVQIMERGGRRSTWRLEIIGDGRMLSLPIQGMKREQVEPLVDLVVSRSGVGADQASAIQAQLPYAVRGAGGFSNLVVQGL